MPLAAEGSRCHILAVIVGFGGVVLGPVYGLLSKKRKGAEGLAIAEAAHFVGGIAEKFIMAVPVFGILMVLISKDVWKFDLTWIWLAIVFYSNTMLVIIVTLMVWKPA